MKIIKFLLLTGLSVFSASCGYQFEGGGYVHKDVSRVSMKVMENKTSETGAGIAFTNALIREILQKTDTKVVDESEATAVFEGTIKSITFASLSRSTVESVIERRISAIVDLKLLNKEGDVIWSVKDFKSKEAYRVSQDKITDESNKREAVEKIATRTAEKLIGKMLTNF